MTAWTGTRIWVGVACGGLLLGFLLPWVQLGGILYIPGYRIPEVVSSLANGATQLGGDVDPRLRLVYLLYLIPLGAVLTAVRLFSDRDPSPTAIPTASLVIGALLFAVIITKGEAVQALSIGAILTVASACCVLWVLAMEHVRGRSPR